MEAESHKVIVQVSSVRQTEHTTITDQISNLLRALPGTTIMVVVQGGALPWLLIRESRAARNVDVLIRKGVVLAACENAMKRNGISSGDLLPGVTTVRSALAELVLKQEQGWAYVRIGT